MDDTKEDEGATVNVAELDEEADEMDLEEVDNLFDTALN